MIHLLYSNCIPILTYASAIKDFPSLQIQDCGTAINDTLHQHKNCRKFLQMTITKKSYLVIRQKLFDLLKVKSV